MKHHRLILKQDMLAAFQELGMQQGMTVMVHSSLSSLGYVCGGAQTVIRALLETVTREVTIVMATESWKNLDPDAGVHNEVGSDDWQAIRDNWPPFDKRLTPTDGRRAVAPSNLHRPSFEVANPLCNLERPSVKPATRHGELERPSGEVAPLSENKYDIEKIALMHYSNEKSHEFLNKCSEMHSRKSLFEPRRELFHSFSVTSQQK